MSSLGRLACTWRSRASNRSSMGRSGVAGPTSEAETDIFPGETGTRSEPSAGMACRTVAMLHYRPLVFCPHERTQPLDDHWQPVRRRLLSSLSVISNVHQVWVREFRIECILHRVSHVTSTRRKTREPNVEEPEVQNGENYAEKPLFCCIGRGSRRRRWICGPIDREQSLSRSIEHKRTMASRCMRVIAHLVTVWTAGEMAPSPMH